MKRYLLYIFAAVVAFAAVSCGKKKEALPLDITGDWNITGYAVKSASVGGTEVDIWVSFSKDKSFKLYQKLGEGRYSFFSGTWSMSGSTLSGKYSDGTSWASSYEAALEDGGSVLVLTSGKGEENTFRKGTMPSDLLVN